MTAIHSLCAVPRVLLATHLYMNTPPADIFLNHKLDMFVSKLAVLFSNSWYDITGG